MLVHVLYHQIGHTTGLEGVQASFPCFSAIPPQIGMTVDTLVLLSASLECVCVYKWKHAVRLVKSQCCDFVLIS